MQRLKNDVSASYYPDKMMMMFYLFREYFPKFQG